MTREEILNIGEACGTILDFIDSCTGGGSWLKTPDGKEIPADVVYLLDGLHSLEKWAKDVVKPEYKNHTLIDIPMPTTCRECEIAPDIGACFAHQGVPKRYDDYMNAYTYNTRPEWCPLHEEDNNG